MMSDETSIQKLRRKAQQVRVGSVVAEVEPVLLKTPDAARFIGRSEGWLVNTRSKDAQRFDRGEALVGPAWVKIGSTIYYPVRQFNGVNGLVDWLKSNAEPMGQMPMPGRAS